MLAQTPLRTVFLSHVGGMIISSSSEEVLILPRAEHDEHYRASTHSLKVFIQNPASSFLFASQANFEFMHSLSATIALPI